MLLPVTLRAPKRDRGHRQFVAVGTIGADVGSAGTGEADGPSVRAGDERVGFVILRGPRTDDLTVGWQLALRGKIYLVEKVDRGDWVSKQIRVTARRLS